MSTRLIPLSTSDPAPIITVQRPVILIGRHPDCDVRINQPQISRRHCCLAQSYDRLLIRDLGSRNGVRVNGRVVSEARLEVGDEIAISHLIFRVESEVAASTPAPRPVTAAPAPASAGAPLMAILDDEADVEDAEPVIELVPLDGDGA